MSDAERWKEMIGEFERRLGRLLTAEERAELEEVMPEVERQIAKARGHILAAVQFEKELAAFFGKADHAARVDPARLRRTVREESRN